jgi:hypothetical protein
MMAVAGMHGGAALSSRIDGTPIHTPAGVSSMRNLAPGKTASLDVSSSGFQKLVAGHVGAQPDQAG